MLAVNPAQAIIQWHSRAHVWMVAYVCRMAGHMMREKVLDRPWKWTLIGQLVGVWHSHDKAQTSTLDDKMSSRQFIAHIHVAESDCEYSTGWSCNQRTVPTPKPQRPDLADFEPSKTPLASTNRLKVKSSMGRPMLWSLITQHRWSS